MVLQLRKKIQMVVLSILEAAVKHYYSACNCVASDGGSDAFPSNHMVI